MTPIEQALIFRANAAEYLLIRILAGLFTREGDPEAAAKAFAKTIAYDFETAYLPNAPAMKSDAFSQEVHDIVHRIVQSVAELLAQSRDHNEDPAA